MGRVQRWNHNVEYHRLVLAAVPAGARTALDVGTGDGLLAAELHRAVPDVVGLDPDAAVLESARREDAGVTWVQGDLMTHPFPPATFDLVASIATLHHLPDLDAALARMAELTAPGGVVAVVGVGRSSGPVDLAHDLVGAVQHRVLSRRHGWWEHSAPVVWPPPFTHAEAHRAAERVLPGATWRRLPLWRHLILWTKPV
jgi:ubiquinone/menaquinone biosynthesis C-methylase UbiE